MLMSQWLILQNAKVSPNEDLFIHLNSSLYSAQYLAQYFYSYLTCFLPFVQLLLPPFLFTSDHRMGMINMAIIDTVPMPIKVGTWHGFCDFHFENVLKWHSLRVDCLVLFAPFCCTELPEFREKFVDTPVGLKFGNLTQKSGELAALILVKNCYIIIYYYYIISFHIIICIIILFLCVFNF